MSPRHASVTVVLSGVAFTLGCVTTPAPAAPAPEPGPSVFIEAVPGDRRADPPPTARVALPGLDPNAEDETRRAHARELFRVGLERFQAGDVAQALDLFEQAYAVVPLPALLFNIARCEEQLGRTQEACAHYRAISADPDSDANLRDPSADRMTALGC